MLSFAHGRCKPPRVHSMTAGLTLTDLPLEELLPHLAERAVTGTLSAVTRHARKKLYLIDGRLAGVASDNPRELLGHFLVGWGLIGEAQLAEAMQIQERLGTPLGRILERIGAVEPENLESALRSQAEEAVLDLFFSPVEEKRLLENVVPADRPLVLRLPLPDLVMEGMRRRDRLDEIRRVLGGLEVIPARSGARAPGGLSGRELHILAEIDGERDVEAIALACHLVPFHVGEFVERGVREGFLAVRPADRRGVGLEPRELEERVEAAIAADDLQRAWQSLERLRGGPADPGRQTVTRLERGVAELLARRRIAGHLVPSVLSGPPLGDAGAISPAEAFVLSRVNDRWSLREIARIAPLGELEFGVIIDSLVSRKLIELRHPKGGPAVP